MTDEIDGRRVLVTGGAGFVGGHLAAALADRAQVHVLDDFSTGAAGNVPAGARLYDADVRDDQALARAMRDADVVFHQAGMASVEASVGDPVDSHGRNVAGTLSVLEAARRHDARVVLASSAAIYGPPQSTPIAEDHPKRPTSPYGVDKLAADRYAQVYAARYGLATTTLRYFNVYGPGQADGVAGVVTTFLDRAQAGRPIEIHGDGRQTRDFVHVADVVRANLLAATGPADGRAYNVGTGTETAIVELAELVQSLADRPVDIEHVQPRDGDVENSRADITRARGELGYDPQVSLREGLRALAADRSVRPARS